MNYYWPSQMAKAVAARSQVARTSSASQSLSRLQKFATQSSRRSVFIADGAKQATPKLRASRIRDCKLPYGNSRLASSSDITL